MAIQVRHLIFGYVVAFLSDIFDGIIARKLKVSTVKRSQADLRAQLVKEL